MKMQILICCSFGKYNLLEDMFYETEEKYIGMKWKTGETNRDTIWRYYDTSLQDVLRNFYIWSNFNFLSVLF